MMRFNDASLIVPAGLLMFGLIIVAGCGGITITDEDGSTVKISGDGAEIKAEGNGGEATITTGDDRLTINSQNEDGSSTSAEVGEGAALSANFPSQIPVFEPAKVIFASENITAGSESFTAAFETEADMDEVVDFYKTSFESRSFEFKNDTAVNSSGGKVVNMVVEKEGITCTATIAGNGEKPVSITLIAEVAKD